MDIKLFESIRQGSRAVDGNAMYEELTGRSTASVAIAKDWLQALKDIVAEKADPLKVIAEFDDRINSQTAKGDLSDIYAHIRQQMPDTTDLGLVAANMASIEQWIKQEGNKHEKAAEDGELPTQGAQSGVNEAMGDGDSPVTAVKKPSKVNSSGDTPSIIKTKLDYTDKDALDAFNTNQNGTVGDEIVEDAEECYGTDEGYYVDEDNNIFYVYESGDAFYVDEDYEPVEAEDTYLGNIYTHEIFGEALEVVETRVEEDTDTDTVRAWEYFVNEDGDIVYFDDTGDLYYATDEEVEALEERLNEDINIYYNGDDGQGGGGIPPEDEGGGEMPPDMGGDPNAQGGAPDGAPDGAPQEPMQVELIKDPGGASGEVNGVVIDVAGKHIEIGPDGIINEQPAGAGGAPAPSAPPQGQMKESANGTRQIISRVKAFFEDNDDYKDVKRKTPQTAAGGKFYGGIDYIDPDAVDALNSGDDIDGHKAISEERVGINELFIDGDGDLVYYRENGDLCMASNEDKAKWAYAKGGAEVNGEAEGADEGYTTYGSPKEARTGVAKTERDIGNPYIKSELKHNLRGTARDLNSNTNRYRVTNEVADTDVSTVAMGIGKSMRSPKGDQSTIHFDGDVINEKSMIASGDTSTPSTPETPEQFYNLGHKDFRGKPVGAKDREKPDQKNENVSEKIGIVNVSAFNTITKPSNFLTNESWKSIEDIDSEHGVTPNKN